MLQHLWLPSSYSDCSDFIQWTLHGSQEELGVTQCMVILYCLSDCNSIGYSTSISNTPLLTNLHWDNNDIKYDIFSYSIGQDNRSILYIATIAKSTRVLSQ